MGRIDFLLIQTALCAWFTAPYLARPEVDTGDLFFIADLAKTANKQVVLAVGNENNVLTHLPLLLTSAHLAEGGAFDQHLVVVRLFLSSCKSTTAPAPCCCDHLLEAALARVPQQPLCHLLLQR